MRAWNLKEFTIVYELSGRIINRYTFADMRTALYAFLRTLGSLDHSSCYARESA